MHDIQAHLTFSPHVCPEGSPCGGSGDAAKMQMKRWKCFALFPRRLRCQSANCWLQL